MCKALTILCLMALWLPCGAAVPQEKQDTLSGKNKIELEKRFLEEMLEYTPHSNRAWPDNLERVGNDIYLSDNGWYENEAIRNTSYFKRSRFTYSPLCETAYPVESVMTLLTGYVGRKAYTVHLLQHRYGYTAVEADIPLAQLLEYCVSKGCIPYVGIVSSGGDQVSASLFMAHPDDGYCHTFRFTIDKSLLDMETGVFQAEAYTYTPIDNLKQ